MEQPNWREVGKALMARAVEYTERGEANVNSERACIYFTAALVLNTIGEALVLNTPAST